MGLMLPTVWEWMIAVWSTASAHCPVSLVRSDEVRRLDWKDPRPRRGYCTVLEDLQLDRFLCVSGCRRSCWIAGV